MTAVVVEIALPSEHQSVAGVVEHRDKLAAAATEMGFPDPQLTDTKVQLASNVPINIALQREKLPVAVALHWQVDSDPVSINHALASIRRQFDVEYATVDGMYVATPVEAYGLAGCLTD